MGQRGANKLSLENIIMGNIQGLYPKTNQSKVPFLKDLAVIEDPIFIALTETHLKKEVKDAEITIEFFFPYTELIGREELMEEWPYT